MGEKIGNSKKVGFFGGFFLVLGALLFMAVIYVSAILLQTPEDENAERFASAAQESVPPMQSASMNDADALAQLFGAPLPYLPGYAMAGQGTNANYEGANARLVTMEYSGVTISAVRPAAAAPLLLRGELSVSLKSDLAVLRLPAVLAQKGSARCVYLSGADAAYSVYAPQAGEEDFLSMLEKLQWTK